jgi:hypothetical protein
MGFALWIEGDQAWVQGLHEYRPMGVAVIALTDRFRARDFSVRRAAPPRSGKTYAGLFASLNEVNARLAAMRRSQPLRKNLRLRSTITPPWI